MYSVSGNTISVEGYFKEKEYENIDSSDIKAIQNRLLKNRHNEKTILKEQEEEKSKNPAWEERKRISKKRKSNTTK